MGLRNDHHVLSKVLQLQQRGVQVNLALGCQLGGLRLGASQLLRLLLGVVLSQRPVVRDGLRLVVVVVVVVVVVQRRQQRRQRHKQPQPQQSQQQATSVVVELPRTTPG